MEVMKDDLAVTQDEFDELEVQQDLIYEAEAYVEVFYNAELITQLRNFSEQLRISVGENNTIEYAGQNGLSRIQRTTEETFFPEL